MAKDNRKIIIAWAPHPGAQEAFMQAKEFEVLYGGSRGGGKTASLIAYMTLYLANPEYSGLLLRRTFPQLLQVRTRAKRLYTLIDPGCRYNKDDNVFEFSSGATIQLGHVQHDDDVERYQGFEYGIIGFEELTQFKEQHYDTIKLSCRSGNSGIVPMVRATANPRGIGHGWVKKRFINKMPPGTTYTETLPDGRTLTRKFIKATVYDNPTLMKNDPQYLAVLMGIKDPRLRAAMLDGDWDAAEGMFFSDFCRDTHVRPLIDVFPSGRPTDGMPVYASLDWGYSKPFSIHWHTVNRYDKIITFKEFYGIKVDPIKNEYADNVGVQMIDEDVAHEFVRRCEGLNVEYLVADPSIKAKSGLSNKQGMAASILQTFIDICGSAGIPVILGNNDRKAGWMQMKARMSLAPDGQPWWIITDNNRHLIRTMPDIPEDMNDPDDCDCFVAGTLIQTQAGLIPIENISVGDMVETPLGLREVIKSGLAGMEPTTIITLSDGRVLEGTNDHKVYIESSGLLPLCKVLLGNILSEKDDTQWLRELCSKDQNLESIQDESILCVAGAIIKSLEQRPSIWPCGENTTGMSPKDTTSITKDTIFHWTLTNWNSFIRHLTGDNISKKDLLPTAICPEFLMVGGEANRDGKFYEKTLLKCTKTLPNENLRALIVVNLLSRDIQAKYIAQKYVERQKDIKKSRYAPSVAKNLEQNRTHIKKSKPVVISVVGNSEKKPVYYLTVKQAHLFYANGILSANTDAEDHCVDDCRYLFMQIPMNTDMQEARRKHQEDRLEGYRQRSSTNSNLSLASTYH